MGQKKREKKEIEKWIFDRGFTIKENESIIRGTVKK